MGVWDDLGGKLRINYTSEDEVRKPGPEDLDLYERESGFKLPDDYREFVLAFGPGTFGEGWEFLAPGFSGDGDSHDLATLNRRFMGDRDSRPDFVRFSGKEDFHGWFGWDPLDVTDPGKSEYGIYLLMDGPPTKVASTFYEFVMSFALGGGFERRFEGDGTTEPSGPGGPKTVGFSQVL